MKALIALAALVLIAGCSKNDSNNNNGFNPTGPGPQNPTQEQQPQAGGKGFTSHPWCYAYNGDQGPVQDRFYFQNGGTLAYEMFDFQANRRGASLGKAQGQWGLQGSVLTMKINGETLVFQVQYVDPDPVTRTERLHVYMNGGDAPYDPCN